MDAPLGWPEAFGSALAGHAAGRALPCGETQFFQRLTDRIVRERIGKRPLEVTANFIARTAFRALALLEEIRCTTGKEIPLFTAYRQTPGAEGGCIESYPAGWAVCYGIAPGGARSNRRSAAFEQAERRLGLTPGERDPRASEDEQDALMCCAAGLDYLDGCVTSPAELEARIAEKEGWMWLPLDQAPGRD
jgi:hypothetical protein